MGGFQVRVAGIPPADTEEHGSACSKSGTDRRHISRRCVCLATGESIFWVWFCEEMSSV
jgi:hypothetical protein